MVGALFAQTDSDGDGIPDDIEKNGLDITLANGKKQHLDLAGMGASPTHKDIFVWVDWMSAPDHTHKPLDAALTVVQNALRDAPVSNLDNRTGIALHVVVSPIPVMIVQSNPKVNHVDQLGVVSSTDYDWTDFNKIKMANFPKELQRNHYFHYCLFAHSLGNTTITGFSKIGGYDFVVSLGDYDNDVGTTEQQAGTFMHELGHNLGLRHGGKDDVVAKPNYLSVMNYLFQFHGLTQNGVPGHFDYSRFELPSLNEGALDSTQGITRDPSFAIWGTQFYCPNSDVTTPVPSGVNSIDRIDWKCDGSFGSLVNSDVNQDGSITALDSQNDWSNIQLVPLSLPGAGAAIPVKLSPIQELTVEKANRISLPPVAGLEAEVKERSVVLSWKPIPLDRVFGYIIFRKSEVTEQPAEEVGKSETSSFVDKTVMAKGNYSYFVTAAAAPVGANKTVDLSNIQRALGKMVIADKADVASVKSATPTRSQRWEDLGMTNSESRKKVSFPSFLIQTKPSKVISVSVE
jgi:hypothetical protein